MWWYLVLIFSIAIVSENSAKSVTVSVYYESLCPDSVKFIKEQFEPAYTAIKQENIKVDLVPFGKASAIKQENGTWGFTCQHGPPECYGNKVHACAIALGSEKHSTDFVICAMKSGNASSDDNLKKCANETNITWSDIEKCVSSGKGDELLVTNGNRTDAVTPKITFIPTIIFDDVYMDSLQKIALKDFLDIIEFLIDESECTRCKSKNGASRLYLTTFSMALVSLSVIKVV